MLLVVPGSATHVRLEIAAMFVTHLPVLLFFQVLLSAKIVVRGVI